MNAERQDRHAAKARVASLPHEVVEHGAQVIARQRVEADGPGAVELERAGPLAGLRMRRSIATMQ